MTLHFLGQIVSCLCECFYKYSNMSDNIQTISKLSIIYFYSFLHVDDACRFVFVLYST